jgi:energy-coupling factor transport system ATP-binding protein
MIRLTGVTYRYPEAMADALRGFDWQVAPGDFVLIAGRSGSGKSTLLRCLNGLAPHFYGGRFGGRVEVAGRDAVANGPAGMSDAVGFVFQDPEAQAVLPTVEEELAFGLENLGAPPPIMRRRVEEALDLLGIAHLRHREISTLSGGERQRVAVASVMALQPPVLALDEPTSQLDPLGAEEVLSALHRLNSELGVTIALAEHRLERVIGHADRLLYLPGPGQPAIDGPVRETLRALPLGPPLVELGRRLEWEPLPLTIREGRRLAVNHRPPALKPRPAVPAGDPPALELRGVSFAYGDSRTGARRRPVLREISLRVEPGELVALMGRNGAGKSTLLRLVMGLLRAERGGVRVAGREVGRAETAEIARLAGYVPQQPALLLFADSVRAELEFTRRHHPDAPPAGPVLAALDLADLAERYPRDLSVGEQQRTALAAILAAGPRLLLLDEPTRGMDYAHKADLARYLAALMAAGVAVVLATHDVELVARCADRVVILGDGELIADGPPRAVLAGSLTFAPQVNRLFGGEYLTLEDVLGDGGH